MIHISFYIKPKNQEPLFLYDIRTIPVPYHMNEELIDESESNIPIQKSNLQQEYWQWAATLKSIWIMINWFIV